jgi:opacity protein-like surface antigen
MPRSSALLWVACVFLLSLASAAEGQVAPAAAGMQHSDLSFGTGLTSWDPDWGNGRMLGVTVWSDFRPPLPSYLAGFGAELEARDVDWHRTNQPANYRQATIGGGPIYTWSRYRIVQPYAKFLVDFAGMNFSIPGTSYSHDTRTAYVPGGGLEACAYQRLCARLDYEYQVWQPMFAPNNRPTPQGFTLGLRWDVGQIGPH